MEKQSENQWNRTEKAGTPKYDETLRVWSEAGCVYLEPSNVDGSQLATVKTAEIAKDENPIEFLTTCLLNIDPYIVAYAFIAILRVSPELGKAKSFLLINDTRNVVVKMGSFRKKEKLGKFINELISWCPISPN